VTARPTKPRRARAYQLLRIEDDGTEVPVTDETEFFEKCTVCGQWIDIRDLAELLRHEEPGHQSRQAS